MLEMTLSGGRKILVKFSCGEKPRKLPAQRYKKELSYLCHPNVPTSLSSHHRDLAGRTQYFTDLPNETCEH